MPIRALSIITLAEIGGAQRAVAGLLRGLAERGYDLALATGAGDFLVDELRKTAPGVRVYRLRHLVRDLSPVDDLRALYALWKIIGIERPHIVHCHSSKAGAIGRLAAALRRVPVRIFTAHGWAFTEGVEERKRRQYRAVEALLSRLTTQVICVSRYDADLAVRLGVCRAGQVTVIPNGIPGGTPNGLRNGRPNGVPARAEPVGLSASPQDRPLRILMVGRLAEPKDPVTLIAAAGLLRRAGSLEGLRTEIWIAGDGPLRAEAEEAAAHHGVAGSTRFLGWVQDVQALLGQVDVFVLSSRWEGLPLSILEAMGAGLPVVATRVGGVPELVQDGVNGYLVPAGDAQALAGALKRLLLDAQLRERFGRAGKVLVDRHFREDVVVDRVDSLYRSLLSGHQGRWQGMTGSTGAGEPQAPKKMYHR